MDFGKVLEELDYMKLIELVRPGWSLMRRCEAYRYSGVDVVPLIVMRADEADFFEVEHRRLLVRGVPYVMPDVRVRYRLLGRVVRSEVVNLCFDGVHVWVEYYDRGVCVVDIDCDL